MIKNYYENELSITRETKLGSKGRNVLKIQEWLNLWRICFNYDIISVERDEIFGLETEYAVRQFQANSNLPITGVVDSFLFSWLCSPILNAFSLIEIPGSNSYKDLIVPYAVQHMSNNPREFIQNWGPWVRCYMDGNEGVDWPWCVGFIQTVLDMACSTVGIDFRGVLPATYSCDVMGEFALKNGMLIRNSDLENATNFITPGDILLIHKGNEFDWTHTGIIKEVYNDYFITIEGNTNDEGAREGFEVCERYRPFVEKTRRGKLYMNVIKL